MRYRLIYIFTVLLFLSPIVSGQYYETGQDPASLKWKQIKTDRFTVIYPEKYGPGGIAYAKSLDEAYSKLLSLFPEKKFKIPVVIHSYSIMSNGYVAWAPKRIELYTTPDQNTIPLSTEKQLAIHELTHVLQMKSLNRGFSKGMSLFFGEQFTGVVASLLPVWFLEGDAVFAESVLTQSGRGRTPAFQKQLKTLIVDNKITYKYDKILNGSYKDFVPDYYQYGYQMVTWALTKKDPQVWNKVLTYTAEQPFTLNPVNISLTRNTGLRKKTLWEETADSLRNIWSRDVSENNPVVYDVENPDKQGEYINYYSPVFAGTDSIIAVKTSLSRPPSFVLIDPAGKTEKRIHTPGQVYPWFISYAKGNLVWVETISDPRWVNREYSVIKLMDIQSHLVRKLTTKSRYLAASVSPDGNKIVAVENTVGNINNLVLLNTGTGSVIQSFHTPANVYLQHPQWSADGKKVTFVFLTDSGEGITSFNPETHEWETLIEASKDDLQSAFLKNDSLFFISSSSGTDNIYLRTPDNKTTAITNSGFGTIDIGPYQNKVLFSDYATLGNNICSTTTVSKTQAGGDKVNSSSFLINRFDIKTPLAPDSSGTVYVPEPYRKWQHLFRFHSWMPFYADIEEVQADPTSIRPGFTILTQNTLSTITSTIGYEYSSEKRHLFHSRVILKGWYPVLESQLDYGFTPGILKTGQNIANPSVIQSGISFKNTLSIPLQFSSGRFSQFLRPSLLADYLNQYIYKRDEGTYDYGQTIITGRLYFANYHRSAIRDIYPRLAQIIDFNYRFAPFDNTIYGSELSLRTSFFFPGFFHNNGIKLTFEAEKQYPEKYLYGNFSSIPRGYENIISKEIKFVSADYVLPLVYPDFNVSSLLYLKRIRTGLFYDRASGPGNSFYKYSENGFVPFSNSSEKISIKSFGLVLFADFHILRIPYMISGGVQSAWKNLNESPTIELLFSIDLFGFTLGKF